MNAAVNGSLVFLYYNNRTQYNLFMCSLICCVFYIDVWFIHAKRLLIDV